MKFLVLALCVCAASAAYTPYTPTQAGRGYKPQPPKQYQPYQPQQVVQPFAKAVEIVPSYAPVATAGVANAAYAGAKAVVLAPVAAAKAAYDYTKDSAAEILRSDSEVNAEGFQYGYETSNGISGQASGYLKTVDNTPVLVVEGQNRYTSPEGVPVQISYIADENGYQPQGDVLPVGPPTPEPILRALEYIRLHPSSETVQY